MANGTVKWFNTAKGYGFIAPEDGTKDVFVHITALEKAGLRRLDDGQKVSFELATEKGKTSAVHIQLQLKDSVMVIVSLILILKMVFIHLIQVILLQVFLPILIQV